MFSKDGCLQRQNFTLEKVAGGMSEAQGRTKL